MGNLVTQNHFIIAAQQQRVWKLLGSAIFQSLPLEEMNNINQTTFYAIFRWRLGFISIPLDLKGRIVDVIEPDSLGAIIRVKKGIMQLGLKVAFALKPVTESKTKVTCNAIEEGKGSVMKWVIRRWERNFAEKVISSIGERLEKLC